jgi:hypothetical protein
MAAVGLLRAAVNSAQLSGLGAYMTGAELVVDSGFTA